MANEIVTHCFKTEGFSVNSMMIDGDPWFIAKEIADILGYYDTENMTRRLDDDERLNRQFGGSGQNRDMTIINESGLYSAIMGSKKPEAKKFKKWVTSEVLPSIRKTGAYIQPTTISEQEAIDLLKATQALVNALRTDYERDVYNMHCRILTHFKKLEHKHGKNAHDALENGMAEFCLTAREGEHVSAMASDHYEYACVDSASSNMSLRHHVWDTTIAVRKLISIAINDIQFLCFGVGYKIDIYPAGWSSKRIMEERSALINIKIGSLLC